MLKKKLLSDEALLFFIFFITILIVNPIGNFPLNDDWAYFYSVKTLIEKGILKISDWASPSLVFQILAGTLFCKIFSLSYTTLRVLTLLFSFSGILFFYFLLNKLNSKKPLLFSLLFFLNPLYLVLSFTFMTDIYYISLTIISLYFYFSGYKKNKISLTILGSIFASFSILVRQIGVFTPFSVFLFYLVKEKKIRIETFILPLITFTFYSYWFNNIHHSNWAHEVYLKKITAEHFKQPLKVFILFLKRFFKILPILFSFLFPLWLSLKKEKGKKFNIFFYAISIILLFFYIKTGLFMGNPKSGNYLHKLGLGVITLGGIKKSGFFVSLLFFLLFFLSLIGIGKFLKIKLNEEKLFLTLPFILQSIFMLSGVKFFDRYLLTLIPALLILFTEKEVNKKVFTFFLVPLFCLSVLPTQDYLAWNRAKWKLGKRLIKMGTKPEEISAGFDWEGHFIYHKWIEEAKKFTPLNQIGEWDWQKRKIKFVFRFGRKGLFKEKYFSLINFRNNYISTKNLFQTRIGTGGRRR